MQSTQDSPQQACSSTQKQARYCCRCRNHGVLSEFKGHRQQCPYKECPCDECTLVTERRRIIAKQTALKRRQQEKARKVEAVLATSSSDSCLMIDEKSLMIDELKGSCLMIDESKGSKKKKKKCSKDLDGLYRHSPVAPSMEPPAALLNCPSLSSSFSSSASSSSCFSPCPSSASSPAMEIVNSPAMEIVSSPAMEIVNSPAMEMVNSPVMEIVNSPAEFASNGNTGPDVIKFEQVIFKPIEEPEPFTQDSPYTVPQPIYAPTPLTSSLPFCPTTDRAKLAYVGDLPSYSIAHDIPMIPSSSVRNYSCGNSSSISTPTAPSFSVAPGVISSSNNISKTYPYDNNNYGVRPSSSVPSAVTGYGMLTTQPNLKESCSKMNLLMRVFPEHKPNAIQAVLESCGGDPIRCIEMILNLQDAEKKPNIACTPPVKCEPDIKPIMSPGFGTPLASPVYIHQSPHPGTASLHPADMQHHHPTGVQLASSSLSFGGIPSVVTTYHQSGIQSAPSLIATMNQTTGPAQSYPEHHHHTSTLSVEQHHAQEYAQGATPVHHHHQHHIVDDTPTLPGPVTTRTGAGMSQFGGTTPSRITVNTIPSPFVTGSVLCPHQTPPPPPATPSSLQLHGIPIGQLPATPTGQLHGTPIGTQDAATSYRFHSSPSVSSLPTNLHLTPSHTTQVYCQTIGSIQPGKCLSYTSLQAAAISLNPASSPPGAPIIVPVMRENHNDINQNAAADHGVIGSAFSRWHEPASQLSQVTGGNNLTPFLVANQMVANQETNHAVEAVHALVSLRTTPPRKQQMNESNTINDLLLEEE